jgi:hypothetical protein
MHIKHLQITELNHDTVDLSNDGDNTLEHVTECRFKYSEMCTVSLGKYFPVL